MLPLLQPKEALHHDMAVVKGTLWLEDSAILLFLFFFETNEPCQIILMPSDALLLFFVEGLLRLEALHVQHLLGSLTEVHPYSLLKGQSCAASQAYQLWSKIERQHYAALADVVG